MTPARVLAAAGLALVFLTSASVALAAGRVALVVGNSTYSHIARLPNPENDDADMASALRRLGFDVTTAQDADRASLNEALRVFTRESVGADMALVFYAGHGLEMDGVNYLVPVDARLERDTDVRFETVALDDVLAATAGASLRMVSLDACRNNPLARSMQRTVARRSVSGGSFGDLNEDLLGDETLVAYAAAAGTTAADGRARHSPYTAAAGNGVLAVDHGQHGSGGLRVVSAPVSERAVCRVGREAGGGAARGGRPVGGATARRRGVPEL